MKFTKGYWMNREGVQGIHVVQVREAKMKGDCLYLYTVSYAQDERALDEPMIELYISSPRPDIIRMEAYHFSGSNRKVPEFSLYTAPVTPEFEETAETVSFKSGDTKLVITKNPCTFTYYYKDKKLTSVGNRFGTSMISAMQVRDDEMMIKQLDLELHGSSGNASRTNSFMRVQLDLDIGEKVYGLGERFTPFVKNGQSFTSWNEDGGTCTDIAYKCIPFYMTNRNYGVFVNELAPVSYEICTEHVTRVQFSVPGEKIDFMVIGGENPKDVISRYTALTGKPALPPAWSFGLWLTPSSQPNYVEDTIYELVDGMRERDIPLHVFLYDAYAMKENEWCSFEWNRDIFPNIEEQLRVLKEEKNLHICFWLNSYIAQKSPLFQEAKALGYLLKKPNGDVWQWDLWQAGMGIVDFTNPDAYKWFQDKLRKLLDQGIDCFKTDFGERIPTDIVFHDGSDPLRMHNYYTYLYNKCVFELLEEYKGKNGACLFARSATTGCQQFPIHWGGDPYSSYAAMSESLRAGLSLCLSGFGFWSHDISGYEGTATADVYKRWAAFGLLSTHSRLHGSSSYRVPWLFSKEGEQNGEESVAVVKFFTELKCVLMPYIFSTAVTTNRTGIPSMRAMVMEFPGDINCENLDRQYMLGDSLLVAPVFSETGEVSYYLPEGKWTHLLSNEVKIGGKWMHDSYDYFSLPLFVKENTMLPMGSNNQTPEYDYTDGLTLHVFELGDTAELLVNDMYGADALKVRAIRKNGEVTFTLDGAFRDLKICLRNVKAVESLTGATADSSDLGLVLHVQDNTVTFKM